MPMIRPMTNRGKRRDARPIPAGTPPPRAGRSHAGPSPAAAGNTGGEDSWPSPLRLAERDLDEVASVGENPPSLEQQARHHIIGFRSAPRQPGELPGRGLELPSLPPRGSGLRPRRAALPERDPADDRGPRPQTTGQGFRRPPVGFRIRVPVENFRPRIARQGVGAEFGGGSAPPSGEGRPRVPSPGAGGPQPVCGLAPPPNSGFPDACSRLTPRRRAGYPARGAGA